MGKPLELPRMPIAVARADAIDIRLPALILWRNESGMLLFLARALVLLQNKPMIY